MTNDEKKKYVEKVMLRLQSESIIRQANTARKANGEQAAREKESPLMNLQVGNKVVVIRYCMGLSRTEEEVGEVVRVTPKRIAVKLSASDKPVTFDRVTGRGRTHQLLRKAD